MEPSVGHPTRVKCGPWWLPEFIVAFLPLSYQDILSSKNRRPRLCSSTPALSLNLVHAMQTLPMLAIVPTGPIAESLRRPGDPNDPRYNQHHPLHWRYGLHAGGKLIHWKDSPYNGYPLRDMRWNYLLWCRKRLKANQVSVASGFLEHSLANQVPIFQFAQ